MSCLQAAMDSGDMETAEKVSEELRAWKGCDQTTVDRMMDVFRCKGGERLLHWFRYRSSRSIFLADPHHEMFVYNFRYHRIIITITKKSQFHQDHHLPIWFCKHQVLSGRCNSGCNGFKTVLLNLLRFRSPLPSIAAFPFALLWMHGRRDSNHSTSNVHCYTTLFALLYQQRAFRHATNWLRSSNVVCLQFRKMFFRFISTCTIFSASRVNYDWQMEGILLFTQIFVLLLEKLRGLVLIIAVFVL